MEDKIEITGILFFAFFAVAGAIIGVIFSPSCWWLYLLVGGILGFLSGIIISFFLLLVIICAIVFICLFALGFLLLKNLAEEAKRLVEESKRRIKRALRII